MLCGAQICSPHTVYTDCVVVPTSHRLLYNVLSRLCHIPALNLHILKAAYFLTPCTGLPLSPEMKIHLCQRDGSCVFEQAVCLNRGVQMQLWELAQYLDLSPSLLGSIILSYVFLGWCLNLWNRFFSRNVLVTVYSLANILLKRIVGLYVIVVLYGGGWDNIGFC